MERSKECNICSHNMDKKGNCIEQEENNNKMYIYRERKCTKLCTRN